MAATEKGELVPRPPRKTEYEIRLASADSRKGWWDLAATIRNPMAETWGFLTRTPLSTTPTNYRLKGKLGMISRAGTTHERWQHKPTAKGTARIWFYVHERTVYLEQVHTSHPNETKYTVNDPPRAGGEREQIRLIARSGPVILFQGYGSGSHK